MTESLPSIRERYQRALEVIGAAALRVGRGPESIRLVVVTKSQPLSVVQAAVAAGARIFGENYPEEGVKKILSTAAQSAVEWHMIGHVQSRKAGLVAEHFSMLHSLDSLKLAQRLNQAAGGFGRTLPVLLEFNVAGEESKHGWSMKPESSWSDYLSDVHAIRSLANLKINGLMSMPPPSSDPESSRTYFQLTRRLRDFFARQIPEAHWDGLSMGTRYDYPIAVEEGA